MSPMPYGPGSEVGCKSKPAERRAFGRSVVVSTKNHLWRAGACGQRNVHRLPFPLPRRRVTAARGERSAGRLVSVLLTREAPRRVRELEAGPPAAPYKGKHTRNEPPVAAR